MFKKKRKRNTLLQEMGLYPGGLISGIIYSFENGSGLISGWGGGGGGLKSGRLKSGILRYTVRYI